MSNKVLQKFESEKKTNSQKFKTDAKFDKQKETAHCFSQRAGWETHKCCCWFHIGIRRHVYVSEQVSKSVGQIKQVNNLQSII